jgi:superoxide dismutase, Fe-Mn family
MLKPMNRREVLGSIAGTVLATATLSHADAKKLPAPTVTPVAPGSNKVVPLAFNPAKLPGLSEKLLTSHHQNNYGGAVKNLNAVELELDKINKDTPGFQVSALRERELTYANSVYLHEAYFENLGGNGKASGEFSKALDKQFGSAARWEELVRATAMSLGGGSGWVVIALSARTNDLRIVGSGGHSQALAAGTPIFVLDMYEHSYAIDYGSAHAKYIDAFFANLNWAALDKRWQAARTKK